MTITTTHTKACFDAWINCENLMASLCAEKHSLSKQVLKIVDECAVICMGTFHALKTFSPNIKNFALLCVGICEECAEICEDEADERLRKCAQICRKCSEAVSKLAFSKS